MPVVDKLDSNTCCKRIIFVNTKDTATTIWQLLSRLGRVGIHHSCLTKSTRQRTEADFRDDTIVVVVATIGFGIVSRETVCTRNGI